MYLLCNNYYAFLEPISIIGLSLNDTCLKEGSSIAIRCNIRGFPRPSIEFQQNGIEITPEEGMFKNILQEYFDQVRKLGFLFVHYRLHPPKLEKVEYYYPDFQPLIMQILKWCKLYEIKLSPYYFRYLFFY